MLRLFPSLSILALLDDGASIKRQRPPKEPLKSRSVSKWTNSWSLRREGEGLRLSNVVVDSLVFGQSEAYLTSAAGIPFSASRTHFTPIKSCEPVVSIGPAEKRLPVDASSGQHLERYPQSNLSVFTRHSLWWRWRLRSRVLTAYYISRCTTISGYRSNRREILRGFRCSDQPPICKN
jgi:hypothetical protein